MLRTFAAVLVLLTSGASAFAGSQNCAAYCVPLSGYAISVPNTWIGKTHYDMLSANPYRVESASYVGMQRLCSGGVLANSYVRVHLRSNVYNEDVVMDGDYVKDLDVSSPDACMTTVTD